MEGHPANVPGGWTDCGRPGTAVYVCALTVYEGHLYAGAFEAGEREAGHVYRYDGEAAWTDCGAPDRCNAVTTLAVYDGRYDGGESWTNCGRLGAEVTAFFSA